MRNMLSMSLAEWLMRMSVAKVPAIARTLAIYASVLDITGNDELASVTGISGRTFDKHKMDLVRGGWVLILRQAGGRGRGIEVTPAVNETPVKFTDVSKGNPRKICARLAQQTPANFAEVIEAETPAEFAPLSSKTPAVVAEVSEPRAPARAYKELPSEVVIYPLEEKEDPPLPPATLDDDPLTAFEEWNALAQRIGLPVARSLTPQRRKSISARMREHGGLNGWRLALANVESSAFLRGENDRGWRADLDFLLQASRFAKVVDGGYGSGARVARGTSRTMEIAKMLEERGSWL